MSVTTPTPVDTPAPVVPEPVQEVEQKVEAVTPAALKPLEADAEKAFDSAVEDTAAKGKAAAPAIEAKDPVVTKEVEAVASGNLGSAVTNLGSFEKEVKAGYKTTEFWLTLVGVVLTQLGALKLPGKYGDTITTSALLGSYAVSRGLAKKG